MRVVILGCGYLGIELGRQLTSRGCTVTGVRRSDAGRRRLRDAGLDAVQADVTNPEDLDAVPDAEWVVYAASPDSGDDDRAQQVYVDGLETAIDAFGTRNDPPDRLVYISSTGVYEGHRGDWVDESTELTPETERGEVLAAAERVAIDRARATGIDGTVVRLAGLYGPGRYRLNAYLEGPIEPGYRNLIHRADAAGAIAHLFAHDLGREEVFLAVDDEPVDRWVFADWLAERCGEPYPTKRTVDGRAPDESTGASNRYVRSNKRCSNDRLRTVGFGFRYPTFRSGYRAAIRDRVSG